MSTKRKPESSPPVTQQVVTKKGKTDNENSAVVNGEDAAAVALPSAESLAAPVANADGDVDDGRHPDVAEATVEKQQEDLSAKDTFAHGEPEEDADCVFCCELFSDANYVEYSAYTLDEKDKMEWKPSPYCSDCIKNYFIDKQWSKYIENLEKADCAAALRRVLTAPPPVNVKDKGFLCDDNGHEGEVQLFWYKATGRVARAKLKDSLVGEARAKFWAEKKEFMTATEQKEAAEKDKEKKA